MTAVQETYARVVPMLREDQFCGRALRELKVEPFSSRYSEYLFQNSSCVRRVPLSSASVTPGLVSSFGSHTTLSLGATSESPIRHSSISSAQKLVLVSWLSQSMTRRYSSLTWRAIQTTVP